MIKEQKDNMRKSVSEIHDPIIRRIVLGVDHKEIKAVFGLTDSELQAKLDEVNPPKVAKKKAAKKKK